ncbi:Innexin [Dictyocaulus viviparus]|uniref:Innexin n=1 Tax=Dictyocaulus viviparus TaxID=29172 RepID=A0A0D8Y4F5_DICVI|nr:Innexin [Dictyocaulus viviparus]
MAFCFYIPRGVWKIFSPYSGLALADLMTAARRSAKTGDDVKMICSMARTLRKVNVSKVVRYGSSLFNLYIVMKVLMFTNLLLQFFFLNHFLGTAYTFWGVGILMDLIRGRQWQQSGHFPRVAFCDLTVREMGNVNNWTVQCVLMVNMFNEKIFIFLWFWFGFLLFCTSINLFIWTHRRFNKSAQMTFLHNVLSDDGLDTTLTDREEFYNDVVKDDGILVLLLLDANGGRLQSGELAYQLWTSKFPNNYKRKCTQSSRQRTIMERKSSRWIKIAFQRCQVKYVYTIWILCGTSFFVFAKEYVGAAIQCWTPRQWAGGWEQYAEQYCLIENTYFVRMNDSYMPSVEQRENSKIRYYQWVPFVLLLQALILYTPRFLWKQLMTLTKINLPCATVPLRHQAKNMKDFLDMNSILKPIRRGTWTYKLTASLLLTKLLSIVVIIGEIYFIGCFMDAGHLYGLRVVVDALNGRQWDQSGNFPRVTFCDLEVRELGGAIHKWSLQCVLMESSTSDDLDCRDVSEFCKTALKTDGVTTIHLIEENATVYQAANFVLPLWKEFMDHKSKID